MPQKIAVMSKAACGSTRFKPERTVVGEAAHDALRFVVVWNIGAPPDLE
jgi:hypothetical protein